MIIAYKYKLYKTGKTKHLDVLMNLSCEIYNHCIALHRRYYRLYKKTLYKGQLQKHITKLKHTSKEHWNHLGSQVIQEITDRIEEGYKKFFKKENKRPPKFRKRSKYKSFTFKGTVGYKLHSNNQITVNSIKKTFKFWLSRPIEGKINTLTIKRDTLGDYYISISLEKPMEQSKSMTGRTAGFDFGLKVFLTSSEPGIEIESPEYYKNGIKRIKKASRELSRKQKGSHNRKKARLSLARVHKKVENQRESFHWTIAHQLINKYDVLCFEDLNLDGMKRLWGRKISDLALDSFMRKLSYLSVKHGKKVVEIDRYFPSSKTCSGCGSIHDALSLKNRVYKCTSCGLEISRDFNAAVNIHRVGTSTLAGGGSKTLFLKQPLVIAESLCL